MPRRGKSHRSRRPARPRASLVAHPPQFRSTIQVSRRVRYTASSAGSSLSLTRADLLNHLVVNTSANANARVVSGFKLNRFEIWGAGSSSFGLGTSSVEWTSTYGPSKVVSDTSMTIEPSHVVTTPPPQSLASFWSLTGSSESDVIAILNFPANSVLDMNYEVIFQNLETPVSVSTVAAGTVGNLYMLPLFGIVSNALVPVSYNTIF
jgi:hypothetical protein